MSLSDWPDIPAYKVFCKFVDSFPLTNDHTERAIKRTSDYINFGSKGEQDLQAILQAVESAIARVPNRKTRKALIAAYDPDEEEAMTMRRVRRRGRRSKDWLRSPLVDEQNSYVF